MRELKGDWRDLFNGFMLALDPRKMFLAFAGLLFTIIVGGGLTYIAGSHYLGRYDVPGSLTPHALWNALCHSWHAIYSLAPWFVQIGYSVGFLAVVIGIWAYFGGAIARIAAYEIAKDGERIETTRAMKFAQKKFWSFFFAPVICAIGFLFFYLCTFAVGFVGRFADLLWFGGPLVALFLPLAILAGFIMLLIVIGTFAGAPLFTPAVAAEGTDAFDAVSRGFSYVYSRPWHFLGYQGISAAYGWVCVTFVFLFAVGMAHLGLKAGTAGFDTVRLGESERFEDISNAAWASLLSQKHGSNTYDWSPQGLVKAPHPYGRMMHLAHRIVHPDYHRANSPSHRDDKLHLITTGIVFVWLLVILGHAYGYAVSFLISQQTMIYYILRKKVDGIEMNEVYDEEEENPTESPSNAPVEKKEEGAAEKKS